MAAHGPGEAWATGYEHAADGLRPMLYRWDGGAWSRDTPFPGAHEPGGLGKVRFVGEEVWIFHHRAGGAGRSCSGRRASGAPSRCRRRCGRTRTSPRYRVPRG
ncbi:hypothetical protein ACOBQB_03240 [Streptomyces sp. G5(2025)]|uniref:hypothetical protein n=1 Tax=Streptomyces sp. G5(2025) TaxID=3406628 RepID=UPI003C1BF9BA